ncbi:pseudouridine synthase [Planctomycetota bacterium]
MGTIKLHKFMAACGAGSRRTCEGYIQAGEVTVNGETVTAVETRIDESRDRISWRGEVLHRSERTYLILNKPAGYLTTNQDDRGRPTVFDLIEPACVRLFAVGRLDIETEGLLILTDDGDFGNRVAHPRYGVHKTYEAGTATEPTAAQLDSLRNGIVLDDRRAEPLEVTACGPRNELFVTRIVVAEGRKRIVRRLFDAIGLPVRRLVRTGIGEFTDDRLGSGESRVLKPDEIKCILDASRAEEKETV